VRHKLTACRHKEVGHVSAAIFNEPPRFSRADLFWLKSKGIVPPEDKSDGASEPGSGAQAVVMQDGQHDEREDG
jgi:hypothetical protein